MSKRLFVGNLSFDISQEQLQEAFEPYGCTGATIPTNDNGRPKGFGFVDVADEQVDAAIAGWNGKELGGRTLAVDAAKPRPDLSNQGGYGGRSGGYRGRRDDRGGSGGGGGGGGGGGRRW